MSDLTTKNYKYYEKKENVYGFIILIFICYLFRNIDNLRINHVISSKF